MNLFTIKKYNGYNLISVKGFPEFIIGYTKKTRKSSSGKTIDFNMDIRQASERKKSLINRRYIFKKNRLPFNKTVFAEQVHGNKVEIITDTVKDYGFNNPENAAPAADGLITNIKYRPLCILTADCQAIVIIDTLHKVVANVHSGWKGVFTDIITKTIRVLIEYYNSEPENLYIISGPSICKNCYEVSKQFIENAAARNKQVLQFITKKKGKLFFDIPGANFYAAEKTGIPKDNIFRSNECTYENNTDFYSYRRDKKTGRIIMMGTVHSLTT